MSDLTLGAIAAHLQLDATTAADTPVHGLATLEHAGPGQISFLAQPKYRKFLATTQALAVLVKAEDAPLCVNSIALVVADPYAAYARVSRLFEPASPLIGIHPSAQLGEGVQLGAGVAIGPGAVIGSGAVLGEHVIIEANAVVGSAVRLGARTHIHPQVTLYPGVSLGEDCRVLAGAVIGGDGFGYANERGRWQRIAQLGSVRIGNRVEIGANTTIDRGAIDDTVIADDVIIDNQVQIGHNVRIGNGCAIAGAAVFAGSTTVGKHCIFGGTSVVNGHIHIGDGAQFTGMSMIMKSVDKPGVYSSGVPATDNREWRRNAARFYQLDDMVRRVKRLEQALAEASAKPLDSES